MVEIAVPKRNDSMSSLSIDNKEYIIRFTYNEMGDYWSFGLYDASQEPIIAMTKIVPDFPLLHFYTYPDLPDVVFGAISNQDRIGRNDFWDGTASFVYLTQDEL